MTDVVVWEGDGHTFRIKSDDVPVVETPFPTLTDPAEEVLGRDPDTGLPMWSAALAPSTIITIVLPDTGPLPLPDDTTVSTTPTVPPTVVPEPVVDNCGPIRCGAAHQLATKLADQYGLIRGLLQWMLSAPFLLMVGPPGFGEFVVEYLLSKLALWLIKTAAPLWVQAVITAVGVAVKLGTFAPLSSEALDGAGQEQLAGLAYNNLTCTDNTFKLTPEMIGNWGASILLDDVDFTEWQRHLLGYCIQFTPFGTYDQTAASGAQNPSDLCSDWTGP